MATFSKRIELPVSAQVAFAWHERPGAFGRLTPPWEKVEVLHARGGVRNGACVAVRVRALGPTGFKSVYRHTDYVEGARFVDIQERGPFRKWRHEHRFHPAGDGCCVLEDHIEYEAPPLSGRLVHERLNRMFTFRHAVTLSDLTYEGAMGAAEPKTILVSGSTGLVGRALCARLTTRGHAVRVLSRRDGEVCWDPGLGLLDEGAMAGIDAVIHLAGEPIAQRWSGRAKERILNSRVQGTRLLVDAILKTERAPVYLAASGINYYGYMREEAVTEDSRPGVGFLAEVCHAWEGAAAPLAGQGVPSVFLRSGIVLNPAGGALAKMLPAFRAGLGGPIASGKQRMSWVALDDLVEMFLRAVEDPRYRGPLNAVAPEPIDNRVFTRVLGSILRRPALLPMPALAIKMLFGEMGRETVLSDLAVLPARLQSLSHSWRLPDIESALRHCLGRTAPGKSDSVESQ